MKKNGQISKWRTIYKRRKEKATWDKMEENLKVWKKSVKRKFLLFQYQFQPCNSLLFFILFSFFFFIFLGITRFILSYISMSAFFVGFFIFLFSFFSFIWNIFPYIFRFHVFSISKLFLLFLQFILFIVVNFFLL